jgi:hypothetical protein
VTQSCSCLLSPRTAAACSLSPSLGAPRDPTSSPGASRAAPSHSIWGAQGCTVESPCQDPQICVGKSNLSPVYKTRAALSRGPWSTSPPTLRTSECSRRGMFREDSVLAMDGDRQWGCSSFSGTQI